MFADLLLALGLLLTTASQLRIPGSPFGPGELILAVWLLCAFSRALLIGESTRPFRQLVLFWWLFAIALSLGTVVALATNERFDPKWFLHDVMAYLLVAPVACLAAVGPRSERRMNRVAWLVATLGGISMAILVAGGWRLLPLPFNPWFWERFRGWSQNPNQLSELCGVLAFICIYLAQTANRWVGWLMAMLCALMVIYVGVLTQSDTFRYALAFGLLVLLVSSLWVAKSAFARLVLIGGVLFCSSGLPLMLTEIHASNIAGIMSKGGGKKTGQEIELRETLWREALWRGSADSWMLGLGPGPHLNIPAEIAAAHASTKGSPDDPGNTVHPQEDGTANFEAHNTFFDLFTQGGLVAVGSLAWLLATASWRTYVVRSPSLIALLGSVSVLMLTGNIIRLPVVWFALALCLVAEPRPLAETG